MPRCLCLLVCGIAPLWKQKNKPEIATLDGQWVLELVAVEVELVNRSLRRVGMAARRLMVKISSGNDFPGYH